MRTSDVCPTCSTYVNALCVIYNGSLLETLNIATLDSVETALIKIETWALNVGTTGAGNIYTTDGSIPTTTNRVVTIPAGSSLAFSGTANAFNFGDTITTIGGTINGTTTLNDTLGIALFDYQTRVEVHANEGIRLRNFGTGFYHDVTSQSTGFYTADLQDSSGTLAWLSDTLQKVKVSLSGAQVQALNTTPQTIVAAPGAGRAIKVHSAAVNLTYGTVIHNVGTVTLEAVGGSTGQITFASSAFTAGVNTFSTGGILGGATGVGNIIDNVALQMTTGVDGTQGDGTIDVYVTYEIINI